VARAEKARDAQTPGTPEHARAAARVTVAGLKQTDAENAHDRTQTAAARLPCLQAMQANVQGGSPNSDGRTFVQ
jgi:hypothetical protein